MKPAHRLRRATRLVAALLLLAPWGRPGAAQPTLDRDLVSTLEAIRATAPGRLGVAVGIVGPGPGSTPTIIGREERFPMQSVFKLPLAMAVLDRVDKGSLRLDQVVRVTPEDFVAPHQHSPLRDDSPGGTETTVLDLVRRAAGGSDGTAADVLLDLIGGPERVTDHLRSLGVEGMEIRASEKEIGENADAQYHNWATPEGAFALLAVFGSARSLSSRSHAILSEILAETTTGRDRLAAGLPPGTRLEHKTGSSRTVAGLTAATNDIGIVTLPDGRAVGIAVFLAESRADDQTRAATLAAVAHAVWTHLTASSG